MREGEQMKIYIAGPMTGLPKLNFPAFDAMRDRLISMGHTVVSPADISREMDYAAGVETGGLDWDKYMERDLAALATCDCVVVLEGWHRSRGAGMEVEIARTLGVLVVAVVES